MSWLLFLDESGHDHKNMPYEVRGGVAVHVSRLWPFVRAVQQIELDAFGAALILYQKELKGSTLLDAKRFKFAGQASTMNDEERRKHCRSFLTKGLEKKNNQTRDEFTAYGQACLAMADGIFQLLQDHARGYSPPQCLAERRGLLRICAMSYCGRTLSFCSNVFTTYWRNGRSMGYWCWTKWKNRRTESSSDAWNGISLKLRRAAVVLVGLSRLRFLYRRI